MVVGYNRLEKHLEGRIKAGTLAVQSARGTLPLSVHWILGQRAFCEIEVAEMLAGLVEREAKRERK